MLIVMTYTKKQGKNKVHFLELHDISIFQKGAFYTFYSVQLLPFSVDA